MPHNLLSALRLPPHNFYLHILKIKSHIYISGFMGTGKTTIAKHLAQRLYLPCIDTDHLIENRVHMSISQIFDKKKEHFFREWEHKVLLLIQSLKPHVVSLGGGLVLSHQNRLILQKGEWINLTADPSEILKRIKSTHSRPLLDQKLSREQIEKMLNQRRPWYNMAPYQIDTTGLSIQAVVEKIRYGCLTFV